MRHGVALLLLTSSLQAAAPPLDSPTAHGDRLRDAYFRAQARQLGQAALADIRSRDDWERRAPSMRRQFLDMMGLDPLPPRTDLKATITSKFDAGTFTVENIHFQSLPGLYVTGNLYLPKDRKEPVPGVLYVCGHGPTVIDGIAYGNKVTYQHHAAWFARHGYACFILDTLQLGEVPGLHHGTYRFEMWWWVSLGYTPAGIELWNAMRALDYLETRKEIDAKRLGVTGRSGGGATSWWVGAADPRVQCIIPVAGIADLYAHVAEGYPGRLAAGVVEGHCDCMYLVNTYRWDYTNVMALCAPRPVLLGNSDRDEIFPIPGYRRMSKKIESLYDLLGARDRFALLETKGPHKDTPELRAGAFRWMNRWLKNDDTAIEDPEMPRIDPRILKVFNRLPGDAINNAIHERFRRPARHEIPAAAPVARAWWSGKASELKQALVERVFRGWPQRPPELNSRLIPAVTHDGIRVQAWDFVSEEEVPLRVWLVQATETKTPKEIVATVVDESGWLEWVADLGPAFRDVLYSGGNPAPRPYPAQNAGRFHQLRQTLQQQQWAYAIVTPRDVGRTRWKKTPGPKGSFDHHVRRRFYLLGQTLEGQQIWDIRRAVQCLQAETSQLPLTVRGTGPMGILAAYAALFEPNISRIELRYPPTSHRTGPTLLNVLTVLDIPQLIPLLLPREVTITLRDETEQTAWQWTRQLQNVLGDTRLRWLIDEAE